mmetsp:Transcript_7779/g.19336  ORF Transcript_7779/g.19336 Transcript_7779/m.19336 type:complete len:93 (+) Transcript_7779:22-300(+)
MHRSYPWETIIIEIFHDDKNIFLKEGARVLFRRLSSDRKREGRNWIDDNNIICTGTYDARSVEVEDILYFSIFRRRDKLQCDMYRTRGSERM